jgi:transposase InsO family protein
VTGFRFVDEHQAEYSIVDLCRVAGVSRSSFYAWRTRQPSARQRADEALFGEIREIHAASRCTYGAPRVWGQLRRAGHRVSRKRVARLMATNGLIGAHARRRWRRGRDPKMVPAPDLLNRDFTAERSDLRWVADITEFACLDGKLYLAGIRDLHDRGLAGWSMGERQTTDLVVAALVMALGRRNPSPQAPAPRGSRVAGRNQVVVATPQRWRCSTCTSTSVWWRSGRCAGRSGRRAGRRRRAASIGSGFGRRSPAG